MKQIMKLLIIVLFSPIICIAQKDKMNDLEKFEINGPVKLYVFYSPCLVECFENIEEGTRKRSELCTSSFSSTIEYTFNKNGKLIKREAYKQSDDNFKYKKKELKIFTGIYDGSNKIIEATRYSGKKILRIITYKYDKNGNIVEILYKDGDLNIMNEIRYKYSEDGDLIEETEYVDGEFESTIKYTADKYNFKTVRTYDSDGKLTESTLIETQDDKELSRTIKTSDDKISSEIKFQYSNSGELQEKITSTFSEDEELSTKKTEKYDTKGNLIEAITSKNEDKSEVKLIYTYNEDDYLTEEITVKNGKITDKLEVKYYYDEYDNWIRKIAYLNGRAITVAEAEIRYF